MDSRIAAELLYESEATLRMVDTAIEELRIDDAALRSVWSRPNLLGFDGQTETARIDVPPDFCVHAYWQIQELLECVQHSREALQASGSAPPAADDEAASQSARIDRTIAHLDRLETLTESSPAERAALYRELRQDLVGILDRLERRAERGESLSLATSFLAEAEVRLARLGHIFETARLAE